MPAPLIGLTSAHTASPSGGARFQSVPERYIQALLRAGATPVSIPLGLTGPALRDLLVALDGVLLTGGGDVDPARYGEGPHPLLRDVDPDRDALELELVRLAVEMEKPFLGICRGLQAVNVALGGTLYADLAEQHPHPIQHDWPAGSPRDHPSHPVQIDHGGRLATIVQARAVLVNSGHHQAARRLAPGLKATAHAPDGVVEAVELPGHPFALAVQWHPEWLIDRRDMLALFQSLVQAAAARAI